MTAWSSYNLRRADWLQLPWYFRAFLWTVEHAWPYSKLARAGAAFEQAEERWRAAEIRCAACGRRNPSLDHALSHFPSEDDAWRRQWFTPPPFRTSAEAEAWLARRGTGDPS